MRKTIKLPGQGVIRKPILILLSAILIIAVVVVVAFLRGGSSSQQGRPVPAPSGETVPSSSTDATTAVRQGGLTITISPDQIANAQIKIEVAVEQSGAYQSTTELRTTGTVASNAYKETPVLPVSGGIVRQVSAELGEKVKQGQPLARIFSTELANAQGEYIKALTEHEQHEREHHRAQQLAEIGAISREELEQSRTKLESMEATLASSRQQLIILGMSPQQIEALHSSSQINSIVSVLAPVSGTVINRQVNQGEVVATGKELFRVADLSSVWIIGQLYEKDLTTVRPGISATINSPATPGRSFVGRVSYIDPRIEPQTHTAQVRIEVANPGETLKIGMFVDVIFGSAFGSAISQGAVTIPKAAVQTIGSKQIVFIATDRPGVFIQREVHVGAETDGKVTINSGVASGERIVTDGSFLLRAESLKQKPEQADSSNNDRPSGIARYSH